MIHTNVSFYLLGNVESVRFLHRRPTVMDVFFKGSLDRITACCKGGWAVISLVKMDNSAFLSTTFFESSLTFPIASITNEPKFGDFK